MIVSCGIDFGTSNSALAAGLDGDTAMVDLEHGQPTIPSAIFFDAEKGRVSYGRDAIRNYVEGTEGRVSCARSRASSAVRSWRKRLSSTVGHSVTKM